jgi:hypothetical protein
MPRPYQLKRLIPHRQAANQHYRNHGIYKPDPVLQSLLATPTPKPRKRRGGFIKLFFGVK